MLQLKNMKLLNINTWGGQRLDDLLALLSSQEWDLITLQEVFALQTGDVKPLFKEKKVMNLLEMIRNNLSQQHFFFSSTAGYFWSGKIVEFGNLTISKNPIRNSRTVFYDIDYIGNFHGTSGDFTKDPRNLQIVEVQLEDRIVSVLNTHGIWQLDNKKSDTNRTIEMAKTIVRNINIDVPTIIAGDFNLTPETESIQLLEEVAENLVIKNGIINTRNSYKGLVEVVDYIFSNSKVSVNSLSMLETNASDHNALILDFEI